MFARVYYGDNGKPGGVSPALAQQDQCRQKTTGSLELTFLAGTKASVALYRAAVDEFETQPSFSKPIDSCHEIRSQIVSRHRGLLFLSALLSSVAARA